MGEEMKLKLFLFVLVVGLFFLFGCEEESTNPDTTAPTVEITSPTNNSTIDGVVDITLNVSDNKGIAKVEIYIDGELSGETNSEPWEFTWDTELWPDTEYILQAKAYDTSDNQGSSSLVYVTVQNSDPFVLTLNNPVFTTIDVTIPIYGVDESIEPQESLDLNFSANPGVITVFAETSGETSTGEQVGLLLEWEFDHDATGQSSQTYTLNVPADYFFIYVENDSSYDLNPFYVNYGLISETMDDIVIPNDGNNYKIGYYEAGLNTEVRAYFEELPSWYFYWEQGTHFTLPFTNNQYAELYASGARDNQSEGEKKHISNRKLNGELLSAKLKRQEFKESGISINAYAVK